MLFTSLLDAIFVLFYIHLLFIGQTNPFFSFILFNTFLLLVLLRIQCLNMKSKTKYEFKVENK